MKKIMIVLSLLILLMSPVLLPAASSNRFDPALNTLIQILGTVLVVPLLIKLGRKWGLDISDQLAQDAVDALINIIVNIDFGGGKTGAQKKAFAEQVARSTLTNKQLSLLKNKYGSIEAAVQVAFEQSSLNNK